MTDAEQGIIKEAVHELRNVFGIICGNLELMCETHPGSDRIMSRAQQGQVRFESAIASLTSLTQHGAVKDQE